MKLFDHQVKGAEWLVARSGRGYLADPPGMGKTQTVLAALAALDAKHALVICPAAVRTHWHREHARSDYQGELSVESYDMAVRGGFPLMASYIRDGIDSLVPDEAHYCKHATSQRTRIVMGKDGYARRVPNVIPASGTPMPKNPEELFTQLCFLAPEVLKDFGIATFEDWREMFCVMQHRGFIRGKPNYKCVDVKNPIILKELLDRVMLRRESGDDLPPVWWQSLILDAADRDEDDYEYELNSLITEAIATGDLEAIAHDPHVARMRRRIGEQKVKPLVELLREQLVDGVDKVALFAHHISVLDGLREGLDAFGVAYIDGSTPSWRRDDAVTRFRTDPHCRVFIGQAVACGTGMDGLQHGTNRLILVEPDWTAKVNVQSAARIARTGQPRKTCIVQMVSIAGTLDDAIVAQNRREAEIASKVGL